MSRLELRPLRSFVAVAEDLHFRRAAERLFLTQSALSQQIGQLEDQLGVRLFERDRRGVSLTPAGRRLLEGARNLLHEADELERETRAAGGLEEPLLALGYIDYMNLSFVVPCLRLLLNRYPSARIERHEMPPEKQLELIRAKSLDVGILRIPDRTILSDFVREPLIEGYWTLIIPARHPLAELEGIPVARLAGERLILFARPLNPVLYDTLIGLCHSAGFEPTIVYETTQSHAAKQLVTEGIGLFWAASYMLRELPSTLVARPLTGFDNRLTVHAVWRADNRSRLLHDFLTLLRQHAPLAAAAKTSALPALEPEPSHAP